MTDDTYRKQLEQFGIESTRVTEGDVARQRRQEQRETMLAVVKSIMDDIAGRHYMYSKLDMCRVFTTPFMPGAPDGTAFFSGVQSVGQNLLDDIMQACPEQFFIMITEANARKVKA